MFETGKYPGKTIKELYDKQKRYLQWWLDQGKDERLKQMIMLVTDLKPTPVLSEEEQKEKFDLMKKLLDLAEETQTDYEKLKNHYHVESNADMTIEQLKEAISILEKRK